MRATGSSWHRKSSRRWKRLNKQPNSPEGNRGVFSGCLPTLDRGIVPAVLGFDTKVKIEVSKIRLDKSTVKMGGDLTFSFAITSKSKQIQNLVIDYVSHHVKANGGLAPKVFRLTRKRLMAGETIQISKRNSFRPISTRKYYAGKHQLPIQINGMEQVPVPFHLTVK